MVSPEVVLAPLFLPEVRLPFNEPLNRESGEEKLQRNIDAAAFRTHGAHICRIGAIRNHFIDLIPTTNEYFSLGVAAVCFLFLCHNRGKYKKKNRGGS